MRFTLDLYINQRPFVWGAPPAVGHDFVVIRENTEGPYVGEGGVLRKGTPHEVATQGSVNTRTASSGASDTRSSWRLRAPAGTSPSCTRPTC